uniref:Uncharacterized protein n=1 Tax=Aegilops tauschii subsp. strangulata TaxID=200361 RepID=A0A453P4A9_AEGTS
VRPGRARPREVHPRYGHPPGPCRARLRRRLRLLSEAPRGMRAHLCFSRQVSGIGTMSLRADRFYVLV